MMSCRSVSRVRKKFALIRKLLEASGIDFVFEHVAHEVRRAKSAGFVPFMHWPGPGDGASPSPASAAMGTQVAPAAHSELALQYERSPCLVASMAATAMPFSLNLSATRSMSARPPPRP